MKNESGELHSDESEAFIQRSRWDDFTIYRGEVSVQLRASDALSGEAVAAVRASCVRASEVLKHADVFPTLLRIVECDSALANDRGERLYNCLESKDAHWQTITLHCAAHKIHGAASKTLAMAKSWMKGATRSLLLVLASQQLTKLYTALQELIEERCCIKLQGEAYLSKPALDYRRNALRLFAPSAKTPRKRARVLLTCACLCNGDWRRPNTIEHICIGPQCCPNGLQSTKQRMSVMLGPCYGVSAQQL